MPLTSRTPVIGAVLAAALLFGGLTACSDLTRPGAQSPNFTDTSDVYTINGSPEGVPTGLWLFTGQAVQLDPTFNFDLAFDVDSLNRLLLLPVRVVAGNLASAHSVGLKRDSTTYESLVQAPSSGYVVDSTFVASVGDVFAIQTTDASACGFSYYSPYIYAKLQVLDVDAAARKVHVRFTVDPNCGFRSLIPSGTPKG